MALPKSVGIKLYDDSFVPVLTEGEVKNKRVILTTVKNNQKKAIIEIYEGESDKCSENEYLGKLIIELNRLTSKGEPAFEVNLRLDDNGTLYAKAWDQESKEESELMIENAITQRIMPETLSDEEISNYEDTKIQEIPNYEDSFNTEYADTKYNAPIYTDSDQEKNGNKLILIFIIILLLILLILGSIFLFKKIDKNKVENNTDILLEETLEPPLKEEEVVDESTIVSPPTEETTPVEEPLFSSKPETTEIEKEETVGLHTLEGKKHFIRRGDNLWDICKKYYGDPWYYPDLAKQNGIEIPRRIYAGNSIIIPQKSMVQRWDFSE